MNVVLMLYPKKNTVCIIMKWSRQASLGWKSEPWPIQSSFFKQIKYLWFMITFLKTFTCFDQIIVLFVCIIYWAIMNLYFDLFWCGIICMKQTMYKINPCWILYFVIWYTYYCDKLSYRYKKIMITSTVVKLLLHTMYHYFKLTLYSFKAFVTLSLSTIELNSRDWLKNSIWNLRALKTTLG